MYVTCGSEWGTYSQGKRTYSCALNDDDGETLLGEIWYKLNHVQKLRALGVLADLFVLDYMLEEGAIEPDFYKMRKASVKAKMPKPKDGT
jgi:hypothetical protein